MSFQLRDWTRLTRKEPERRSLRSRTLTSDRGEPEQTKSRYADNRLDVPTHDSADDVRGSLRRRVQIRAEIRESGGGRYDTWVSDISQTGFRMQLLCHLDTERAVLLILPGMKPLRARIAWHEGNFYGCMFEQQLHVAVLDHIARQFCD